jgi:hypothetical protein
MKRTARRGQIKRTTSLGQRPGPFKAKRPAARPAVRPKRGSDKGTTRRDGTASLQYTAKTGTRTGSKAKLDAREAVRSALETYAQRGVFSGFGQADRPGGKTVFSFIWLHDRHMELTLEAAKEALQFDRILPGVKAGTPFAVDLKRLIARLSSDEVPDYRRVDPTRAVLTCSNRQDHLSVRIAVKTNDYEYAVNRMVNVAHELFVYLRSDWPEYLVEYFNEPEE